MLVKTPRDMEIVNTYNKLAAIKVKDDYLDQYIPHIDGTSLDSEICYLAGVYDFVRIGSINEPTVAKLVHMWADNVADFCSTSLEIDSREDIYDILNDANNKLANSHFSNELIMGTMPNPELGINTSWHKTCFRLDIRDDLTLCKALGCAIAYLVTLEHGQLDSKFEPLFDFVYNDEFTRITSISLLHWVKNYNNIYHVTKELGNLVNKHFSNNWHDDVRKLSDADEELLELYLEYKTAIYSDDFTTEKNNEINNKYLRYLKSKGGVLDKKFIDDESGALTYPLDRYLSAKYPLYKKVVTNELPEDTLRLIYDLAKDNIKALDWLAINTQFSILNTNFRAAYTNDSYRRVANIKTKEAEDARNRTKERERSHKKALAKETDKVKFYKEKVGKLTKELGKSNTDNVKVLEQCIDILEQDIAKLNQDLEEKETEILSLDDQLEDMTHQRNEIEAELILVNSKMESQLLDDESEEVSGSSRDISINTLCNALRHKKILLVGGNVIHNRLKDKHLDNIECIKAGDMNFNVANKKYDLVVIYTKLVNHSTTEKLDAQLHGSNIPIIRFNEAGLTSFIHCLFNYIYGNDEKACGMYYA